MAANPGVKTLRRTTMGDVMTHRKTPGRPPKARKVKGGPTVWGNDAQYRFKRALDDVVPAGRDVSCPVVLQRDFLPCWPRPAKLNDPGDHVCLGKPPLPPCGPCLERQRQLDQIATQWNLTFRGSPVQWAKGWFSDALDYWQSCDVLENHELRRAIPVISISNACGSLVVGTREDVEAAQRFREEKNGHCPRCGRSELRGWHIIVPDAPSEGDIAAWERWRRRAVSTINDIARTRKGIARENHTRDGQDLYPPDDHLRLFAWYQVGGLRRAKAAARCKLSMDPSHVSRITGEVADALGLTRRTSRGRPRKRA